MPPLLHSLPGAPAAHAAWRWLSGTFAGRTLLFGLIVKVLAALLRLVAQGRGIVQVVDAIGGLALLVGAVLLVYRAFADVKGVLLWRVRRKLTLSYIFIGFVPVLLVIVLFLTFGALLFFNVAQYIASGGVKALVDQAAFLAQSGAVGLQGTRTEEELRDRLERREAGAARSFPYVSYAVVPSGRTCDTQASPGTLVAPREVVTAGPWTHLEPPRWIPGWIPCTGQAGLIAYTDPAEATGEAVAAAHIVARAIAWPDEPHPHFAVVVDVPLTAALDDRVRRDTGIDIGAVSTISEGCKSVPPRGRALESAAPAPAASASALQNPFTRPRAWVTFLQYVNWDTGEECRASMRIGMTVADLYNRIVSISATPTSDPGARDVGQLLLVGMALVGVLFLVIQAAAFMMGLALARSITGSVHELLVGTERVRRGDFTHKIAIRSRDQLGELADSFNSMTSSIEDLLQEKAEKQRMEQELRIARNIQMSLLPQGGLTIPGLSLSAHCEPAREVGGDYYDYLPIDEHRVGLLIADVAGKGTSAALYMAELKGLMLSLSQLHTSPRRLLIDANRIISRHLDSRSFITITYAVVDVQARTLTYARAGHCPLIYIPGPQAPSRAPQILAPDGLVLGLQIDDGQRFNRLLEEASLPLQPGDLFLFYTDGLTEAMDSEGECFGDARLGALLYEHADMPFGDLRERILREIAAFSGSADQQDDMTLLLLKVEGADELGTPMPGRRDAAEGDPDERGAIAAIAAPGPRHTAVEAGKLVAG